MRRKLTLPWTSVMLACLAMPAFAAEPAAPEVEQHMRAALEKISAGEHAAAVELLSQAIKLDPTLPDAWYLRGREQYRLGNPVESVADFDKFVQLRPDREKSLWERGISHYYTGQFDEGAKQFELYQTYHDNDVENSVWRYLCMARTVGVKKAAATMLPIRNDPRVPMMEIFDLYRGKLEPADVMKAATAGEPPEGVLNMRLFYAHLYLGLYYEVAGEKDLARQHIFESEKHKIGHYMWDVAHVHAEQFRKEKPEKPAKP